MKKEGGIPVERIQTGVRIEKRILKVLKGSAEMSELSLGQLIEILALHAFHGEQAYTPATRKKIAQLREVYGLTYGPNDYKKFIENELGCGNRSSRPCED